VSLVLDPPQTLESPPAPSAEPGRGLAAWIVRWRLALRLARRDARRAKGRTVLVLLMVGLPVMAIVAGDTLYRTNDVTAVESLPSRLGSADAAIQGVARERIYADPVWGGAYEVPTEPAQDWTAEEVRQLLPPGSEVVERQVGATVFRTGIGYAYAQAYVDALQLPIRDRAFEVVTGRVPDRTGEVAISQSIAERGLGVGDPLEVTRDDVPLTVVGVLTTVGESGDPFLVLPPGSAELLPDRSTEFFASVPAGLDWPAVQELNAQGLAVVSRDVVLEPPPAAETVPPGWEDPGYSDLAAEQVAVLALIVAALVLQVVLLAGPAFAVGLRRQRRDLALLAASGGTPADLRRAVLASGLVLGGGAALAGALLGVGLARLGAAVIEDRTTYSLGPFEVPPLDVVGMVLVGSLAGLAAAYVPARQAARTDVVTTLTGRRGQVRSSWRLPVVGVLVAAAGLALTVLGARGAELAVAGGAVLLVVGVVLTTPWLVGLLAPLAGRLPVAGRLAVRDATRNRTRTAPAVAAVMATVAGITTLAIGSASDSAQGRRDYVPQLAMGTALISASDVDQEGWAALARTVERQVPGRPVAELRAPAWNDQDPREVWFVRPGATGPLVESSWSDMSGVFFPATGQMALMDEDGMAAMTSAEVRDAAVAGLHSGRAVVFGTGAVENGRVTIEVTRPTTGTTPESLARVELPAVEIAPPAGARQLLVPGTVVVPLALADRIPVDFTLSNLLVGSPEEPVTPAEETRLREAVAALTSESGVYVERGWSDDLWVARLLLVVVGGALVLIATLTATGLAVADARPDHATLAAIGAAPRTRRLMAMGSATVIGGFGAVLGVLAGLAPGIAVAYPLTSTDYGFGAQPLVVVPWGLLAAVALGVPLLAVLVTGLAVRSRLPMATRITG
jgi:putative ABC transport system permease protein